MATTLSSRYCGSLDIGKATIEMEEKTARLEDTVEDAKVDHFGTVTELDASTKALVRKVDYRIMPIMWAMYFMNYLDRNAIAQARLNDLEKHLHLQGSEYQTCISILFVGYVAFQLPSNILISTKKVRPSLWMSCWMLAWAVISACTALATNYTGLLVCRLLLGMAEAPFYPGALYLLSLFYTRRELATRISILYTALILSTSFSGLIAAATFATLNGVRGLHGWQWLFIIEGALTFAIASLGIILLPDQPLTTRWLSEDERLLAQARIDKDTVDISTESGIFVGFNQAIRDKKLYLLTLMQTLHLASNGFNSFFPSVIKALGFSTTITLVMTCPPYLVSGIVSVLWAMSSGKRNERSWHITLSMALAAVGFIISCITTNVGARYFSCFLFCTGAYACNSIIIGWVTATCGQTQEKKAAALSLMNTSANATYIYTPYMYPTSAAPMYVAANAANAGFAVGTITCVWILRTWLRRENDMIRRNEPASTLKYAY